MLFACHAFPTLFNASHGNESDPEQTTKHKRNHLLQLRWWVMSLYQECEHRVDAGFRWSLSLRLGLDEGHQRGADRGLCPLRRDFRRP